MAALFPCLHTISFQKSPLCYPWLDSLLHQYFYLVGFYFTGRMITPENKNLAFMDHDDQTIDNQVEYCTISFNSAVTHHGTPAEC